MEHEPLIHLIYVSTATEDFSQAMLSELLQVARKNNRALNVTGMLLFHENSFFQILEGEKSNVERLYTTISHDKRHNDVIQIISETIPARSFPDWSMGLSVITSKDLDTIVGFNDFFAAGECFKNLNPGRAKKLLKAYAQGFWRKTIT